MPSKAEHLAKGSNPRFVVTSLSAETHPPQALYEVDYCGRGQMENDIKEQQLFLFADRTSCQTVRANQIRLLMSTVAYVVLRALREFGLPETELATTQCDTIGLKLLKMGEWSAVRSAGSTSRCRSPIPFAPCSNESGPAYKRCCRSPGNRPRPVPAKREFVGQ